MNNPSDKEFEDALDTLTKRMIEAGDAPVEVIVVLERFLYNQNRIADALDRLVYAQERLAGLN